MAICRTIAKIRNNYIYAVLDEDYAMFQVEVVVPTSLTGPDTLCNFNAALAVLNDDIVESDQSFTLTLTSTSLPGVAVLDTDTSVQVIIMDDSDCTYTHITHCTHIAHTHTHSTCTHTHTPYMDIHTLIFLLWLNWPYLNQFELIIL